MNKNLNLAHRLYTSDGKTQKEIAEIVGVSERTIYTWIQQQRWERSPYTPAVIEANLYRQVAELQSAIDAREPGSRFPTMQEAEVIRKLISSAEKLRRSVQPVPTPRSSKKSATDEPQERHTKEPASFRIPKHKPKLTDKQALARWKKHVNAIMVSADETLSETTCLPRTSRLRNISRSLGVPAREGAKLGGEAFHQRSNINDLSACDQRADGNAQYAMQVQVLAGEKKVGHACARGNERIE